MYFTGDLDAEVVLVHLNPRQGLPAPAVDADRGRYGGFEDYFDAHRRFGHHNYGAHSQRQHRSPFDHKQIRFLRPFHVIDFVDEATAEDRFNNLERVIDHKLQLELIPYGSPSLATTGFSAAQLAPHWTRLLDVVAAAPRRYVLFCGAIFEPIVRSYITDTHEFHLVKRDGSHTQQKARFSNLALQHDGGVIYAGLAQSYPRQGIPMGEYGRACHRLYRHGPARDDEQTDASPPSGSATPELDPTDMLDEIASWSAWIPVAEAGAAAPTAPGVYRVRQAQDGRLVYVGMAGERTGGGRSQGLRGRLGVYLSGKTLTSGLGEAVTDRALADPNWLRQRLAAVAGGRPSRARQWGRDAFDRIPLEVSWSTTIDGPAARHLERRCFQRLANVKLWNRAGRRIAQAPHPPP
jgi:hypothetical protein